MSIRTKILAIVLSFFVLISLAFVFYSSATTGNYKRMRLENIEREVEFETEKVNKTINEIGRSALNFASIGLISFDKQSRILGEKLALEIFNNLETAAGGGFWFKPNAFDKNVLRAGVYVFRSEKNGEIEIEDFVFTETYEYHSSDWYREIADAIQKPREIVWTRPYIDDSGTFSLMTTAGAGIFDDSGNLIGLSTVDWVIAEVIEKLSEIKPTKGSFVILAAPQKDYLISNTHTMNGAGTRLSEVSWNVNAKSFELNGIRYMSFRQILDNGWLLSVQIPEKEIFAEIENRNKIFTIIMAIFAILLWGVVFSLISNLVNKPIKKFIFDIARLSGGNLDRKVEVRSNDEIGKLAASFNKMTGDLKSSLEEIARERALSERIGAELNIATQIQASMLPCIFPAFPERAEFDIYASMIPAKEVGGDFYDFFLVNENTLALVIADVSGKGVPAALFMVIAKTLIKNNAQYGKSPKEVFETVNNLLCENNEAGMFVTAFMGYLDIRSGKFTFVNAGHNPPLLRSNGQYNYLKTASGFVLAGIEDMFYKESEIVLEKGDELFLYTDGITEADNKEKELFGESRLLEAVNKYSGLSLKEFTISINSDVEIFGDGADQADDITTLALRYKGV
jgi:sigma-B regulation protein RsbU (phosphoserine phosphatase)